MDWRYQNLPINVITERDVDVFRWKDKIYPWTLPDKNSNLNLTESQHLTDKSREIKRINGRYTRGGSLDYQVLDVIYKIHNVGNYQKKGRVLPQINCRRKKKERRVGKLETSKDWCDEWMQYIDLVWMLIQISQLFF